MGSAPSAFLEKGLVTKVESWQKLSRLLGTLSQEISEFVSTHHTIASVRKSARREFARMSQPEFRDLPQTIIDEADRQMDHPLDRFNEEEIKHYVETLVEQLNTRMELADFTACAWRLADALGAISRLCPQGTMGIDVYTGLGYRLEVRDANH